MVLSTGNEVQDLWGIEWSMCQWRWHTTRYFPCLSPCPVAISVFHRSLHICCFAILWNIPLHYTKQAVKGFAGRNNDEWFLIKSVLLSPAVKHALQNQQDNSSQTFLNWLISSDPFLRKHSLMLTYHVQLMEGPRGRGYNECGQGFAGWTCKPYPACPPDLLRTAALSKG